MANVINLPIPYFQISKDYEIRTRSHLAEKLFPNVDGFLELVDGDSMEKAQKYLQFKSDDTEFELVMKTFQNPFSLFEIRMSWNTDSTCEIICLEKNSHNEKLSRQIDRLRSRLQNTNFELLDKKNELESALHRINELSGPFISLTDDAALIPLFGDLTDEKMELITQNILDNAHRRNQERLYFDFTGVGDITKKGFKELQQLFKTLWYMGQIEAIIIGITPQQAVVLNHLDTEYHLRFVSTLKDAISDLVKHTKTGAGSRYRR
ncbi:STAS domain-containing protein [Pseudalkalibacillus sp. Hm43]|uniref:STAS domain-containing protein n=1 Tax=Pseudalkalibacillus sp. Hm43 TaxID=3450742 RepID=UPI003F42C5B8